MSTPPKPLESPVPDWSPCWSAMNSHESHSSPKDLNTMSPAKPDDLLILKVHKVIKNQKATLFGLLDSHDSAASPAFSFRTLPRKQSHSERIERASSSSAAESQETLETEDSPMSAIKVLEDGRAKRSHNECNAMPVPESPQKSTKKARF